MDLEFDKLANWRIDEDRQTGSGSDVKGSGRYGIC